MKCSETRAVASNLVCFRCRADLRGEAWCVSCAVADTATCARDREARQSVLSALRSCADRGRLRNDSTIDCAHGTPLLTPCIACVTLAALLAPLRADPRSFEAERRLVLVGDDEEENGDELLLVRVLGLLDRLEERRTLVGEEQRLRNAVRSTLRRPV